VTDFFSDEYIMEISTQALYLILLLSAPMLMSALAVGLVVSIIQATTSVQEQTLAFVPKLMATFISSLICGPWICGMVGGFASKLFMDIEHMGPH
jgi:flagellar biosynthetic protein FliQ